MPRNFGNYVESNFLNGLVTEATGLNFPENAVTDAVNVVFKEDGSIERRMGIDYESDYQLNSITRNNVAIIEYLWTAAGGSGDIEFVAQQVGATIYFYEVSTVEGLSKGIHATTFSLNDYKISGSPAVKAQPCSFTSGKGYLFVTHPYCDPFYVSYDSAANDFTATVIDILIRDFEGLEDGLDVDERPTVLSDAHTYNLRNQGWIGPVEMASSGGEDDPITYWSDHRSDYPSNADVWWLYKNPDEQFSYTWIERISLGNTLAPKGRYILSAFNTDRSGVSGITGLTEKTAGYQRPSCCAFFAGRIFYAGVKADGYVGEIYFSQILERDSQTAHCYQANDPTSENNSDLLPTDGGVVRILDIGSVYKLFPTQKALLVFADNGVWAISGSELNSFSAEDYTVKRITSVGIKSGTGVVDVLGSPVYWNEDGVWNIAYENGEFGIKSISDMKIKTFLTDIPRGSKRWVKGAFDTTNGILQFLYRTTEPENVNERYTYDAILCLNIKTGAFYPYTISSATKGIHGLIACDGPTEAQSDTVVRTADNVVDGSSNQVIVYTGDKNVTFRYFVSKNVSGNTYNSTWALEYDTGYLDWQIDSEDYDYTSEVFTGYKPAADGNKEFQTNYVTFHLKTIASSSAFMRGCWDYSNSASSVKWTTAQQIYNSTPTFRDYRMRKLKIRGWGKSVHFKIYGVTGFPFSISGWSAFVSSNANP